MGELLTTNQLAEVLQVNRETIYRWKKEGMPYRQFGSRTIRYDFDEVEQWNNNRKRSVQK